MPDRAEAASLSQGDERADPLIGNPGPAIAWWRVAIALLLSIYIATYSPPPGTDVPSFVIPAGFATVGVLLAVSLIQLRRAETTHERPIVYITVDSVLTMTIVGLFAFDPQRYLFAMGSAVVLEAAVLLGLTAAVMTWLGLSLTYGVKEMVAHYILDVPSDLAGILLRLVVLLGVALVTGSLVEAARASRAFSHEREVTDRLRSMDEMKDAFLSAVSHDLKNPLTAILGFSTILESHVTDMPPEQTREFLAQITRSARKLERMLTDLLDIDRMNRNVLEPHLTPTDMGALVRRIVREIDLQSRPVVIAAEEVTADVDPAKVERIVENLVTNAVKYTPSDTDIDLRVARHDGGVLIAVEDRGQGIPDDQKQAVFEPFHRAPGAEKLAGGTGVGLSLVSKFAKLHGGRAWVEDRPGGGASFRVFLPANGATTSNQHG